MAGVPTILEAARAIGWVANAEHAAVTDANAWAKVAVPKLLRLDLGDWFGSYIGTCTLHHPDDIGSFMAPAAAVRWHPAAVEQCGLRASRCARGETVLGYGAVLLRPVHAPRGQDHAILIVQADNRWEEGRPLQPSAHHEMFQPNLFGPVGDGLCAWGNPRRPWVFIRRDLVSAKHLMAPAYLDRSDDGRPHVTPSTSMRLGCVDAPMRAERAPGWIPLEPEWHPHGHLIDEPVSVDQAADELSRYQDVDIRKLARERRALVAAMPHPLSPFENEPDVVAGSAAGKAIASKKRKTRQA